MANSVYAQLQGNEVRKQVKNTLAKQQKEWWDETHPAVGQIRQGDIILIPVTGIEPVNAKVGDKAVLAEGEVTGHHHVLVAERVEDWVLNLHRYVKIDKAGVITHPEHDPEPKAIPAGTYEVRIQQVYTPEAVRNVAD